MFGIIIVGSELVVLNYVDDRQEFRSGTLMVPMFVGRCVFNVLDCFVKFYCVYDMLEIKSRKYFKVFFILI